MSQMKTPESARSAQSVSDGLDRTCVPLKPWFRGAKIPEIPGISAPRNHGFRNTLCERILHRVTNAAGTISRLH
jgi:hypothetical protein